MTRWTEQDLQTLKSKSRVIVHKQDVHANEPRTNTGTCLHLWTPAKWQAPVHCAKCFMLQADFLRSNRGTLTSTEWKRQNGLGGQKRVPDPIRKVLRSIRKRKGLEDASKSHQDALRGAKAAALRGNWAKTLQTQCSASGMPVPILEHRFHETRKWRFDLAWPGHLIAVEIQGGIWTRGKHVRGNGYLNDMAKRNEANRLGWHVYEFTPNQVKTGIALEYLKAVLEKATG